MTGRTVAAVSPPHNPEAEQALLCAMMLAGPDDGVIVTETLERLGPDAFYREPHRRIWRAMDTLHRAGRPVDLVTITDCLRERGELDDVGGASYVTSLLNATYSAASLPQYVAILARDQGKRALGELGLQLAAHAANGQNLEALLTYAGRTLENIQGLGFDSPTAKKVSWEKRILTAAELLDAPDQEQAWFHLWGQRGLIGPGLTFLLSGHSKQAGKSTSLRAGLRDLLQTSPDLRVLVLSEEPRSIWTRWLATLNPAPFQLGFRFADGSPWTAYLREVEAYAPALLAIDTLRAFGSVADENDSASVTAVVLPLVLLTRRLGMASILAHHLRKSEGDSGLAHAGSTALVSHVDVAAELRQDKAHHPNRRVVRTISRFDETPKEFILELQGQQMVCLGAPDALTLAEVAERTLAVLVGAGRRLSRDDILQGLDDPKPSSEQIARALKTLHGQGRVSRSGRGVRGDPHLWEIEIESTTKPPLSRGIELNESGMAQNA